MRKQGHDLQLTPAWFVKATREVEQERLHRCRGDRGGRRAEEHAFCRFSHGDGNLFRPLLEQLLNHDPYLLLADYQSYIDC
jgi:hypothetical protein